MVHTGTHTQQYVDVTVTLNHGVHTDREFVEIRLDVRIKNKEEKNMLTDKCRNISRQECHTKGSREDTKIKEFICRDTMNVE